ncbi:class I SAM-dependent methyltransferase [Candidatus Pacearchaeota archaeon]|nr:class I SAM-dependent methyltransferase [Candidatus Pacearchaeota archaeon]
MEKCNLCGKKDHDFLFNSKDRMFNISGEFSLYKCRNCGLVFLSSQLKDEELLKHYPSEFYYSFGRKDDKKIIKTIYKTIYSDKGSLLMKILLSPLKSFVRGAKIIQKGKILDIGCGSGTFLKSMSEFGMDCFGVEIGDFDGKYAIKNKLKIYKGDLLDAKYPSNYFDVITMRHVLEHVRDPMITLKEVYRILKKDGTFILETPNTSSFTNYLFGKFWVHYDLPRHFFSFNLEHLKRYAEKNNFKIGKTRTLGVNAFVPSFIYYLNRGGRRYMNLNKNILNRKPIKYIFHIISFPINLINKGDNVELTLKK